MILNYIKKYKELIFLNSAEKKFLKSSPIPKKKLKIKKKMFFFRCL